MKKYILFLIPVLLGIISGCTKDAKNNPVPIVPGVSISSISYPSFVNSTWSTVFGGIALIEFDQLNAIDSVTSKIKDSTDLKTISLYNRVLASGTYNIYVSSKTPSIVADTFIRFSAQLKTYSVTSKQAVSLTATSTDGLITIAKSFIKDNTTPSFKPDSSTQTFKLGLINGYYYLYVKGGTKGTISLTAANGQAVSKSLSVVALNQINMALQTQNGSLQVIFTPFVYDPLAISSSTLLTLNLSTASYSGYSSIYFVATDELGNILNEVKYVQGTSTFKISSLQPYMKPRFNFFEIFVPAGNNTKPNIVGFLQVKKGSTFTSNPSFLSQKPSSPIALHLKNASGFDQLNVSTDIFGASLNLLSDSTSLQSLAYSSGSKVWIQMLKNNQYSYNFFSVASGTTNLNVDLTQLSETPLTKTISAPGNNLQVQVTAKPDTNYSNAYNFGITRTQNSQLTYAYPSEPFAEYDVSMFYSIGSLNYAITTTGTGIPAQAAAFNASFNITTLNLASFAPSFSGTFDYYHAIFQNNPSTPNLAVDLYSPSAANYTAIKLPDFSKYLGVNSVDLSTLALKTFGLYQVNGFDEKNFFYKDYHTSQGINSKAIEQSY